MQSSCRLIKNEFAKQGESKLISTEYVSKNPKVEEELEEIEEEIRTPEIDPEELLKRYEDIGQRILQDANNEKQAIILRTQMEAQAAEKKAYNEGYEQGLQNGYEDGYKKAYEETIEKAKVEAEEIIEKAELLLKSAHENYSRYLNDKKSEVIRLALEIAESIAHKELSQAESMNSIIEEAFKISKGEDNVILRVNSIHAEELKSQSERWKISYGIKNDIFILKDDSMEPGNAILEKPSGMVNVGVDIGMKQIEKAIFG
ncbi:FliH/SctL family protein [Clostridium saccharobutylicum]|uniref:Flagellar assembly protein H n=1 Tax=Clostridium saccharobutylicum TaxID=169679 RepID=A0A1S8NJ20_CLOSA|nr:FliH/SctL family protein [Clostridium saccharobutylicum]OOM16241.1 flagellar assembly protein H [Clostridium saccharobutylicum]